MTANDLVEIWRRDEALDRVGGDENLLHELCQIFLSSYPGGMEKLREAVMVGISLGVQQAAHSLIGELSYFRPILPTHIARSMADIGQAGHLVAAIASLTGLE